ncbi:MAG: ABC transporter ATP-binding protein [Archaeoglobaceae archaeon]
MLLNVENLRVKYGTHEVLRDVSLTVDKGEIVTLIGSNGAGKSTLLRTISGLIKPASGKIIFDGKDITKMEPEDIVAIGITHCPEGRLLFPDLSVYKNLLLGYYTLRKDKKGFKKKLEEVLKIFPVLRDRINQIAGTMSGGEQQMLAIARALMSSPKLLLLDEPSLGLSPKLSVGVFEVLTRIKEKTAILLSEQNASLSLKIADRAYVMELGEIKLQGSAKEIIENPEVKRAYLGI